MQSFDESVVPHSLATVEGQRAIWLGGPGCVRHEAVGESFNKEHMNVVGAHVRWRTDAPVPAWLVLEPGAIMVWILGGRVGTCRASSPSSGIRSSAPCAIVTAGRRSRVRRRSIPAANQGACGIVVWLPPVVSVPVSHRIGPPPAPPVSHPSPKVVAMPVVRAPGDVAIARSP